ncbi:MAG: tryptophan synthase subunit alpha [Thermoprotei archaeon]
MTAAFRTTRHPLIAYLMAGDPEPEKSFEAAAATLEAGADALELGIPFSDPIADGPTIQAASVRALRAGTTLEKVFQLAKRLVDEYDKPIYLMTYLNPVLKRGYSAFCDSAVAAHVSGVIIPDLPVELSADWREAASEHGLETVFLVSPATSRKRTSLIARACTGFIYLVSVYGVTGARRELPANLGELVRKVKGISDKPVALGFGISEPSHVGKAISEGCDGIIVGSALIRTLETGDWYTGLGSLRKLVSGLKAATAESSLTRR